MSFTKKLKDFFAGLLGGKKKADEEIVTEKVPTELETAKGADVAKEDVVVEAPKAPVEEPPPAVEKPQEPAVEPVAPADPAPVPEKEVKPSSEGELAKAIAFAETRLEEKKGDLSAAEYDMFRSKIASFADREDEDAALASISQLIGGIVKAKKPAPAPAEPEKPAEVQEAEPSSEGALSKAIAFAEARLEEKKGDLSAAEYDMFRSKIASFADREDEDAALASISQLIGGIVRAKKKAPTPEAPKKKKPAAKKKAKAPAKSAGTTKKKPAAKKKA